MTIVKKTETMRPTFCIMATQRPEFRDEKIGLNARGGKWFWADDPESMQIADSALFDDVIHSAQLFTFS